MLKNTCICCHEKGMKFTVLWSLSWSCLLELEFHLIRHLSAMERLFKKNNNHICQVQLLTICHYSKFTYIPNTCCSCSSHSVNLLFLGSWKKSTQVTAEYRKIKLYSQTFCSVKHSQLQLETLHGGQFTLSTHSQLIKPNYLWVVIIYMKKLHMSDWLKTSAFFM